MEDRNEIIANIRNTVRGKVKADGIFLTARFRYLPSANRLAKMVKSIGGYAEVEKRGKVKYRDDLTTNLPVVVRFTVDTKADLFIESGARV